jgi:hypothetical protein
MDKTKDTAVFYTIWSYKPGAGAELIKQAAKWILGTNTEVKHIVTLSPQTEMARRFHTKNGAETLQTNATTVNYSYYKREAASQILSSEAPEKN